MTHILELFPPSKYVAAFELKGRDVTVTISKVVAEIIEGENNRKDKRPILYFEEAKKPLVLNKTNAKTVLKLYGADYTKWIGQRVTLFPTTTKMAGETVECVRIRAEVPRGKGAAPKPSEPEPVVPAEPEPPSTEPPTLETLRAQVESVKEELRGKNTLAGVAQVRKATLGLAGDLSKVDASLLDDLNAAFQTRIDELEAGK